MADTEERALRCPMPMIHHEWSDEGDCYVTEVRPCGEPLGMDFLSSNEIWTDGVYEGGMFWRIGCQARHVLVVPYSDGDAPPPPAEVHEAIVAALTSLGVEDVHVEFDPQPEEATDAP